MATTETNTSPPSTSTERWSVMQLAAGVVGLVFLLVGLLGFVPGVTSNLDQLKFVGPDSDARLLGAFEVNGLHNLVHILFGVAGIALARTWFTARTFLVWGGAIYLVLWAYGLAIDLDSTANIVSLNTADNWLHLGLGMGMVVLAFVIPARRARH